MELSWITRRRFFQTLAASVVAAKLPLPVGFPEEAAVVETVSEVLASAPTSVSFLTTGLNGVTYALSWSKDLGDNPVAIGGTL